MSKFSGNVQKGKFVITNREKFLEEIQGLEGKRITVTIEKYKKPRSNEENRYYRGVIVKILADELGYSHEEMHEILKEKFLKVHDDKFTWTQSTAKLSTVEFEDLCKKVRMWASAELQIYIPLPNEAYMDRSGDLHNIY
ncbi:MAG: hypothetical protein CMI54_00385 [Parcubacteria group bacterium]|nr:hypothetical protein [Parcubacteria group bacterium]|tara:strand:- start:5853 stop:6269 length:417 start_codon:yes stop_codon:yes gene_type:complete